MDPLSGRSDILGVGRLIRVPGTQEAEFAILVTDQAQREGLGTEFAHRLLDIARQEGIIRLTADILADNTGMISICRSLGFTLERDPIGGTFETVKDLAEGA